jgi:1-acyl-sn-glycerol-3-phosphate acyltransferase
MVLFKVFYRKLPFPKFFMKKELRWVPFVGIGTMALDFPFMKRYSKEFLEKHPHLRGKDVEITKKACEKFKRIPVAVLNFVEGTRFTKEKHQKQQSPFKHLLKPKAGGISFVLSTMGEQIQSILNVTIAYPKGAKGFWGFCKGDIKEVRVRVEEIPLDTKLIGDYSNDVEFKKHFQGWINNLWTEKDKQIDRLLN